MKRLLLLGVGTWCGAVAAFFLCSRVAAQSAPGTPGGVPAFRVDASWPKPLPNNWVVGQVSWVTVDSRNHVWILHRPKTVAASSPGAECCVSAPPVLEFDEQGAMVQAWGGPGAGYEWPANEHGIAVDTKGSVWVSGGDVKDTHLLKFSSTGKFLLQIGRQGQKATNNDTANVFRAADMYVAEPSNELYVADGETGGNRRVIVFDANSGGYKRHWGAYGQKVDDAPPPKYDPSVAPKVFSNAVHCIDRSKDGLLYVCDRGHDRIQVFRSDGSFVKEAFVARETLGPGSTADVGFSPDQRLLYVGDGTNNKVWILVRDSLEIVGSFGQRGEEPGQFRNLHGLATDAKGNVYTAEVGEGKRVQKFVPIRP